MNPGENNDNYQQFDMNESSSLLNQQQQNNNNPFGFGEPEIVSQSQVIFDEEIKISSSRKFNKKMKFKNGVENEFKKNDKNQIFDDQDESDDENIKLGRMPDSVGQIYEIQNQLSNIIFGDKPDKNITRFNKFLSNLEAIKDILIENEFPMIIVSPLYFIIYFQVMFLNCLRQEILIWILIFICFLINTLLSGAISSVLYVTIRGYLVYQQRFGQKGEKKEDKENQHEGGASESEFRDLHQEDQSMKDFNDQDTCIIINDRIQTSVIQENKDNQNRGKSISDQYSKIQENFEYEGGFEQQHIQIDDFDLNYQKMKAGSQETLKNKHSKKFEKQISISPFSNGYLKKERIPGQNKMEKQQINEFKQEKIIFDYTEISSISSNSQQQNSDFSLNLINNDQNNQQVIKEQNKNASNTNCEKAKIKNNYKILNNIQIDLNFDKKRN